MGQPVKLDNIDLKDIKSGLISETAISRNQFPRDAVSHCINFHFDEIGSATLRKGTTRLGNDAFSTRIVGLYEFRDSGSGANNQIVAVVNTISQTILYYLSGGTWTSKRITTGQDEPGFTTFLDNLFMVTPNDSTAVWDGNPSNSFVTTGNASGAPSGKYIENFRNRVWIAGNLTYPDRVYYSELPSSVTTPVITWNTDVSTGLWIDVSPADGENITALKRSKSALLVFKPNHFYRIYSITESEPDPKFNVGTYSGRSIVDCKDAIYFHHPTGFYRYVDGDVKEVSRPIQGIVDAITLANYTKIAGWQDGDHVYWSIGDVTVDDVPINNAVVRYTISSQTWTCYSYPNQISVASDYNDGNSIFKIVGDENGDILKTNVGLTDNGSPITYALTHRWNTLDGSVATQKTIPEVVFEHDGGNGTNISYQTETSYQSSWPGLGQLGDADTTMKSTIVCRRFRVMLSGTSIGEPFIYRGFEIPRAIVQTIDV